MNSFTDKNDMNKIKKDTNEYVLNISHEFLDCMGWDDTKLNDKMTVKEAMKMFVFMMSNLILTINTDFETSRACFEALAQRTKDLNYEDLKILFFYGNNVKIWPKLERGL